MNNGKLASMIYDAVMTLLVDHKISQEDVEQKIGEMYALLNGYYPDEHINQEMLFRKIMQDYGIYEVPASFLDDNRDHKEWLSDERAGIQWNFWNRYKNIWKKLKNCRHLWLVTQMKQQMKFCVAQKVRAELVPGIGEVWSSAMSSREKPAIIRV